MITDITNPLDAQKTSMLSGAGLLGLVTTGMYHDPLSMYREYIQNAADAAATSGLSRRARVEITIDVAERRIRIRDNGPGLSPEDALERLLPIGRSDKTLGIDRGFRGVGRLAGLAFAKTVSFTTRAHEAEVVTRITWHSDRLPQLTSSKLKLEDAILGCVDVESLPGPDHPEHFFEVEVGDVARHSTGLLLNRDAVRDYVSEACPVPMRSNFPFADSVEGLFHHAEAPLTFEVLLKGDPGPVKRPYGKSIQLSANRNAEYTEFQAVRIPSVDDTGDAAIGWVAHSSYLSAIPKNQRVRGIRARVGNIQIGSEAVFDHLFSEERFNRWCVGELHIVDSRIIPNARRDYFELGPHLRNLENHLIPILRSIVTRCRRESTARNRARKMLAALSNVEDLYALATSGYLTSRDSTGLVRQALREVEEIRNSVGKRKLDNGTLERLDSAEDKLNNFSVGTDPQQFGDVPHAEAVVYRKLFGALATLAPSPGSARELIEIVFAEASRVGRDGSAEDPDQGAVNDSQARLTLDDTGAPMPS